MRSCASVSFLGRPLAIATGADRREVRYRGRAALPHNFGRNFGRKRSLLSPCILTNLLPLKRQRLLVVTCHKLSGRNCSSKLCVCATNSSNLLETFEQRISRYVSSWYPLCPICQTAGRHSPPPYNCSLGGTQFSSARRSRDSGLFFRSVGWKRKKRKRRRRRPRAPGKARRDLG